MKIEILDEAEQDLIKGYYFYEQQAEDLGNYFLDSLLSEIDSLEFYAGIHPEHFGYYRLLANKFPFAVYYKIKAETVQVYAVLDCRRNPAWVRERLS
ncbi:MAG: type II toxin-antitoxin system RelE/ParE family toxin [bacterium]